MYIVSAVTNRIISPDKFDLYYSMVSVVMVGCLIQIVRIYLSTEVTKYRNGANRARETMEQEREELRMMGDRIKEIESVKNEYRNATKEAIDIARILLEKLKNGSE